MTFDEWLAALDAHAANLGLAFGEKGDETLSQNTGRECWQEAYAEGCTPAQAWAESEAADGGEAEED